MSASDKTKIWAVGDSTLASFNDDIPVPRQGYGTELASYFNADVVNLAVSGASSKDFAGMESYRKLLEGLETAKGECFLIIGFGHNDEKPDEKRHTDPNGNYRTEGSFAKSLYRNYIKPALEHGVTPVLCTPITRLTKENTLESYRGSFVHVTEDGDYRKAILDLAEQLNNEGVYVEYIDLTPATVRDNVKLGPEVRKLHAVDNDGLDMTHTSEAGAKRNARLVAELSKKTAPHIAKYSKI